MKHILLSVLVIGSISFLAGQTVVLDFESAQTSTTFQYFGSSLDGTLNQIIANPDMSGMNTSATVAEFIKPPASQTWAGAFSNPNPSIPVDLNGASQVCIKVWSSQTGNVLLKLEGSTTGAANWEQQQDITEANVWTEVCFDVTAPSSADPFMPAVDEIYARITIFFDFGTVLADQRTYYFDDITVIPAPVECTTILDFETDTTTTTFQYFGSSLDPTLTARVANPDPTGINLSDTVTEYIKPADALTWAGVFSNPNPMQMVDLSTHNQVCIKVHMDHIGNVLLKLENATTGGANWEQMLTNDTINAWTELCFDITLPSSAAPFEPATGQIYQTVTLFFDFGLTGAESAATSYFDDIVTCETGGATSADVNFAVDMNNYSGNFSTVYVSGTFNGWSGDANALDDSDSDGIWTTTLNLPLGTHEFKYTLDNWTDQEQFSGNEDCVVTDTSGQFTNRRLVVGMNGAEIDTVCWNSCYACGEAVYITINLGTSHITVAPTGIYVAGGGNFGIPGDHPMTEVQTDVWTITFEKPLGFSSYYSFTNGNCPDYSCKENIAGQSCANPGSFNDRFMGPINADTTFNTCFGLCTENLDCSGGQAEGDITFNVDMNEYSGSFTQVYISGSFNGWSGESNPLDDSDADNIWTGTIHLAAGPHEYKFTLDNWTDQESFVGGESCVITDPSGQFHNRLIEVDGDAVLDNVCFNSCAVCGASGLHGLDLVPDLFWVIPTLTSDEIRVDFNTDFAGQREIRIVNAAGQQVLAQSVQDRTQNLRLELNNLPAGVYFVHVRVNNAVATKRVIKQ